MATYNLSEIAQYSQRTVPELGATAADFADTDGGVALRKVNVALELGGCKAWHTGEALGFDVDAAALNRYVYDPDRATPFDLVEQAPLASMADPETLADFIRWGVGTCPAEKYLLVLWDHGGGSRTGLFYDELFGGDVMYLDELASALEAGGAHFDAIAIDACMMGNLETAQAVQPWADWLVASEEVAAGYGSAFGGWLDYLYYHPACDAAKLCRVFCDEIQKKYVRLGEDQALSMLTYAVIDLSKIPAVTDAFEAFFTWFGKVYQDDPATFSEVGKLMLEAETYGMGGEGMIDIVSALEAPEARRFMDLDARNRLMDAVMDCVVYTVKGQGRAEANGLSFCYDVGMDAAALDIYARNCRSAAYLAYLDAIAPDWTAPDWVYETAAPLTPREDIGRYQVDSEIILEEGEARLRITYGLSSVRAVDYVFFQEDADLGEIRRLGLDECDTLRIDVRDGALNEAVFRVDVDGAWPAIEGVPVDLEKTHSSSDSVVYNIPLQMDSTIYYLRAAYRYDQSLLGQRRAMLAQVREGGDAYYAPDLSGRYEVYGLWEGYNEDTDLPNRNVVSLTAVQGREYQLLYKLFRGDVIDDKNVSYGASVPLTMYKSLELEKATLTPGTYYIAYRVQDIFGRTDLYDPIKLTWDGQAFQIDPDAIGDTQVVATVR